MIPMKNLSHKRLLFLFALSGLSSLVYESLWVRILSLGVGSTTAALSIVLSIFFTGLALGSFVAGRVASRLTNPLRVYAWLEGGIGLFALAIVYPLVHFQTLMALFHLSAAVSPLFITAIKFGLVFGLLILPTLAMGASFPILTSYLRPQPGDKILEHLYGANTIGAVAGAFSTSFFLLPHLGVQGANAFAALLNLAIFATAYRFSGAQSPMPLKETQSLGSTQTLQPLSRWSWLVLIVGAAAGFASISAEIVWNKYLGIFFGTNIYGLGLILTIFLSGIALGALVLARWIHRFPNRTHLLVGILVAAILSMFVSSRLLNFAPIVANVLAFYLSPAISLFVIKCALVALILFPPTAFFGAMFPLMIRVAADEQQERLAQITGLGYAFNTLGAVLASSFVEIYGIPHWGSAIVLKLCFFLLGGGAVALLVLNPRRDLSLSIARPLALCVGAVAVSLGLGTFNFRNIIKSAYVQNLDTKDSFANVVKRYANDFEDFQLIVEGETAVISLSYDPSDGTDYRNYLRLKSNGLNESLYRRDNPRLLPKYEALLGFLPYLFVRNPQTAFVVGYGGGCTTDFLTRSNLRKVDVVELEKGVVEAAKFAYQGENPILKRSNLNLRVEDARYVLASQREARYDIIVSQPSHSWLSGVANLFTQDFFEIVRDRLTEKGVFSQWLNLYNMNQETLKSILLTFYTVFPYGSVYTDLGESQMIMVGSKKPLVLNLQKLSLLTQNSVLKEELVFVPFAQPSDFLTNFSLGRTQVMALTQNAPINTDNNAFAEVHQSKLFYSAASAETDVQQFLSRSFTGDYSDILEAGDAQNLSTQLSLLKSLHQLRKFDKFFVLAERLEKTAQSKTNEDSDNSLLQSYLMAERYVSAESEAQKQLKRRAGKDALFLSMRALLGLEKYDEMLKLGRSRASLRTDITGCYEAFAKVHASPHWALGSEATKILALSKSLETSCGIFYQKLRAEIEVERNLYDDAATHLASYLQVFPSDAAALRTMLKIQVHKPGAVSHDYFGSALSEQTRHERLAAFYESQNHLSDAKILREKAAWLAAALVSAGK